MLLPEAIAPQVTLWKMAQTDQAEQFTPVLVHRPTWDEEQRLMQAILRHVLFFEIRKVVMNRIDSNTVPESSHPLYWDLKHTNVEGFWAKGGLAQAEPLPRSQLEQLSSIVAWLRNHTPSERHRLRSSRGICTCCRSLTPLTQKQRN
jgi:hypothetical protein